MLQRFRSPFVAVLLTLGLGACGTFCRAGKDFVVGLASPVTMAVSGIGDGVATGRSIGRDSHDSVLVQAVATPFACLYHTLEHGVYGLVHIADLPLCVFYGAASQLYPAGHEVAPLDIYPDTWFDRQARQARRGEDIELMSPAVTASGAGAASHD